VAAPRGSALVAVVAAGRRFERAAHVGRNEAAVAARSVPAALALVAAVAVAVAVVAGAAERSPLVAS